MDAKATDFPAPEHDHDVCVADSLAQAEQSCRDQGVRLTPQRRAVLEILLGQHVPLGAYDIMDRVDWGARRPAPVQIYRALDFLIEQGLAHRISSLNAFTACCRPDKPHGAQFLICRRCHAVAEMTDDGIDAAILGAAARSGFAVDKRVVEVTGLCPHCAARAD